jgi:hypothetical protein
VIISNHQACHCWLLCKIATWPTSIVASVLDPKDLGGYQMLWIHLVDTETWRWRRVCTLDGVWEVCNVNCLNIWVIVRTSNCVGGGRRAAATKAWFGLTRLPFRILSILPLRSKSCRERKSSSEGRWELLPSSIACSRPRPALKLFLANTTHSTLSKVANNYFGSLQAWKNHLLSLFIKYVVTFTWELGNVFLTCTWVRCGSSNRSVSSVKTISIMLLRV